MTTQTRLAIIRYKLAARAYRRRDSYNSKPGQMRASYADLETARAAMLAALCYDRPYSYMGEFCNLHERDIPGNIHATNNPRFYDERGRRMADGRYYQESAWQMAVTLDQIRAKMAGYRQRSRFLQSMFLLPPVERFIRGWSVVYTGHDEKFYTAAWRDGSRFGVPYLTVLEPCRG